MSEMSWRIRTQFVGDDGWTHEARVEGPPTPGFAFVEVVPADACREAVERAEEAERALRVFQSGLTDALRVHNVPPMPSWPEAIHWLARNGRSSSEPGEATG
jgi:hypothetical protein